MENSQRMRSFLHLSLATVIAQQLSLPDVYIIDNGILSINLPLVPCRSGSRSTRSTDPLFLKLYQILVNRLFESSICIRNPFIFHTKAEIVDILKDHGQEKLIKDTISCWAYPRGLGEVKHDAKGSSKPITHCGYCLPCIIRRLAISSCGLAKYDAGYARDIFRNFGKARYQPAGQDYSKTEHLRDLLYFCTRITNIQSELAGTAVQSERDVASLERARFLTNYPELSLIPDTVGMEGVDNPLQQAIDMYKRFSSDVLSVVQANGDKALQAWVSR